MKRVCILIMLLTCFILGINAAQAADYPHHLYDDPNFILVGGKDGIGKYLDRSSLVITDEPGLPREIAFDVVTAKVLEHGSDGWYEVDTPTISRVYTRCYRYDGAHKMYRKTDNGWKLFNPNGTTAETGGEFSGEMAYYVAFGEKFSQGYPYPDVMGKNRPAPFEDEFYARADY